MIVVPEPVPLEMPPGDPVALEDVVEDVAGTAYRLAVVSTCLGTASTATPHWRGADASAAAAQVGVVAALAEELSGGVAAAAHRLRAHHDLLVGTRRRVATLRSQQDDDFAVAWSRLSRLENLQLAFTTDGREALGVVEDLRAGEAARRREHDRLLEELADDAAATARVLADACRRVGGTGRSADTGSAIAFLAAELPGWGEAELRRRGADLAEALVGVVPVHERESAAGDAVPYAGSAAFAAGFLAGLGEDGVRELLTVLGDGDLGPGSALARTLGLAFGAAAPTGRGGKVLDATYIDPRDVGTGPDLVALGMGVVIGAGGAAGPRPETVVRWGRQMLDRERVQGQGLIGSRAVDRAAPIGETFAPLDPMTVVLTRLARTDDPSYAADLLSDRATWDVLLSRPWDDGATGLGRLIDHAGREDGPVGGTAVGAGLEALGAGLGDDGDPDGWTVDRGTAAAVSEAMGRAVSSHVPLVAGALERAADGQVSARDTDALRGLGYLGLDAGAARAVEAALRDWVRDRAGAPGAPSAASLAVVPSGFVAVREYGQRLAYALHGFEQQAAAELKESRWDAATTVLTAPVAPARGPGRMLGSDLFGAGLDYAAMVVGQDGVWDNGVDDGLRFGAGDAVRAVLASLRGEAREADLLATRAVASYEATLAALGNPLPPTPPVRDYVGPLLGGVPGRAGARLGSWAPDVELVPEVADELNRRIDDFLHD